MVVRETAIPGVLVVELPVFPDSRGFFVELFQVERFRDAGLATDFTQDNFSHSTRHVLRGLHYQVDEPQGKLVNVVRGAIFDVAVDLRRSSPTYGQWVGETLEGGSGRQVWVPAGFAHGFLVLSDTADVTYKCTARYSASGSRTLRWNDPSVAVEWPLPSGILPNLNERDADAPFLDAVETFP